MSRARLLLIAALLLSGCEEAHEVMVGSTGADPQLTTAPAPPTKTRRSTTGFPIPDPLPAVAIPHSPVDPPAPNPGPQPLTFWIGGSGHQDGRLAYPRAMVTTPEGILFVVDKSGRIQKWSAEGHLLRVVRTPEIAQGKPTGLAVDAQGNLLVADTHYCRVLVYDSELRFQRAYGAQGRAPGHFMLLSSVYAGADGRHYTTDYGDGVARVQVFLADGTYVHGFGRHGRGVGAFRRPMAVRVDVPRDRLYVADAVNHRISVFTCEGEPVRTIGGADVLGYPYDVALDEQNRLWVAEFGSQRVSVFAAETGELLGRWGRPSREPGGLNRPWGVALGVADRLWVLDSGGDRCYALSRSLVLARSP